MIDGERTVAPLEQTEAEEKEGVGRVARLPHLVEALAGAPPEDQPTLALELNDLMVAMRSPGQEAAEAAVVLAALGAHKLDGAVDPEGRSCRKEAVDTLLATGFPHALQVAPEDLEFARSYVAPEKTLREWQQVTQRHRRAGAVMAGLGAAATIGTQALALRDGVDPIRLISIAAALTIAVTATGFALRKPDTKDQGSFGTVIAIGALAQLLAAGLTGWAAVPSLAATSVALLFAFGNQFVPEHRGY